MTALTTICVFRRFSHHCIVTLNSIKPLLSSSHKLIVVTSCKDITSWILSELGSENVIVTKDLHNMGPYYAMNQGCSLLESKFVHFMNEGTTINNRFKADQLSALPRGSLIFYSYLDKSGAYVARSTFHDKIFLSPAIKHESIIYPSSLLMRVGAYNTQFKISSDYDLTLKILNNDESIQSVSSLPLIKYHDDFGLSSRLINQLPKKLEHMKIKTQYLSGIVLFKSHLLDLVALFKIYYAHLKKLLCR